MQGKLQSFLFPALGKKFSQESALINQRTRITRDGDFISPREQVLIECENVSPNSQLPLAAGISVPAIPDYELLERIGAGAYGEVWLARNVATGFRRAVKVVNRSSFEDERPFDREFEGIKKFDAVSRTHPSQLALFHVGRNDAAGYFYYVMELADEIGTSEGELEQKSEFPNVDSCRRYKPKTLRAELEKGRLPAARVLEIAIALSEALAHLHANGLIHRDVKPSNIIFVNGRPKLADIGLVTDACDSRSIVGTEGYLPQEGPGTATADIFALGKVLYEALTGFDRRRFPELPGDIREWPDAALGFELNAVTVKACAMEGTRRYGSAREIVLDLERLADGESVKRLHAWQSKLGWARKAAAAGVGTAAVVGIALFLGLTRYRPEEDARSSNPEVNRLVDQAERILLSETQDRLHQAGDYFKQAAKLDPQFIPAYRGIVEVELLRNNDEDVRDAAAMMMKLDPDSADAHLAADLMLWREWRHREALEEVRKTTKRRAYSKRTRSRKFLAYGFILCQMGRPEEALAQYRLAEKVMPEDTTVQHHLGHPYFERRDFQRALEQYDQSLKLEPNHVLGHYWKGRTYDEMGEFGKAVDEYERADLLNGQDATEVKTKTSELREALAKKGADGYWRMRIEIAMRAPKPKLYFVATYYARLHEMETAYRLLEEACRTHSFTDGLLYDLCWDHNDPRFMEIVEKSGWLK
jgi:serine/threonine protein kinase/Tfp pilus assembly protein PilF